VAPYHDFYHQGLRALAVLVREAGPGWTADDLISSQIWSRRQRWGGPFIDSRGANPTFTLHALAEHSARDVIANWGCHL